MAAAEQGRFQAIIIESLDRLTRDPADTFWLYKRLTHWGIKLLSLADGGEMPMLTVAVKAGLSQQFLIDLGQKTRRGQSGRVKAGRIPGGLSYGYDVIGGRGARPPVDQRDRGGHCPPHLRRVCRREVATCHRSRSESGGGAVPARWPMECVHTQRLTQARERHPLELALSRRDQVPPASICEGPGYGQAPSEATTAVRMANGRCA